MAADMRLLKVDADLFLAKKEVPTWRLYVYVVCIVRKFGGCYETRNENGTIEI